VETAIHRDKRSEVRQNCQTSDLRFHVSKVF
jgi:hypothetical protein